MAGTGEEVFSRDFLCLIGNGDAPPPEQGSRQQPREDRDEEVDLNLALSVGGRFGLDTKGDRLPQSSSAPRPPVEVPPAAVLAVPRASGSPSSASSEGVAQRLQGSGTLMRTRSLPAVTDAAGNEELKKHKEMQSLKRQEVKKKMIERRNSDSSTAFKAGTEEQSSSSSVPSSREATRRVPAPSPPLPPSSLAPRTAAEATLGSSSRGDGDQSILGSRAVAAARASSTGDDVGRRLMQEMPAVHTRDLPNGNRVDGFLYNYRQADDVRIVCICHGRFFTPSEFVEHAGAGKVDHPLRHIAVSTNQTL